MACDTEFLDEQIAAVKEAIRATLAAIVALTTGGVSSYSLDTGQTRQVVSKSDLATLRINLSSLQNTYQVLCNQRYGGGSVVIRPL